MKIQKKLFIAVLFGAVVLLVVTSLLGKKLFPNHKQGENNNEEKES